MHWEIMSSMAWRMSSVCIPLKSGQSLHSNHYSQRTDPYTGFAIGTEAYFDFVRATRSNYTTPGDQVRRASTFLRYASANELYHRADSNRPEELVAGLGPGTAGRSGSGSGGGGSGSARTTTAEDTGIVTFVHVQDQHQGQSQAQEVHAHPRAADWGWCQRVDYRNGGAVSRSAG